MPQLRGNEPILGLNNVQPIIEALEGRWKFDGLVIVKVYTPGVGQVCGE
jgi:hypothetical protein